jgi:hypothetical protein
MDFEDLIVGLVAGLALLWQAAVWLKEQLDKPQNTPKPITVPRPVLEPEPGEFVATPVKSPKTSREGVPAAMTLPTAAERGRNLRRQLGLDQRNALKRSIILMTVLGPCRANERTTSDQHS